MRRYITSTILTLLFGLFAKAQEGIPVYFDYLSDNYYLVYPSMAGIAEGTKIRLTARKQWFSVDEAPSLQTFNINSRIGERSGVGGIFFNDSNGYHSQTGFKATYAHHLQMGGDFRTLNQLSFGLSAGVILSSLDETEFRSVFPDPVITGVKNTTSYFNMDLGASYNFLEFYAHAAILNILGSGRDLYSAAEFDNLRRYLLSVGYVFGRNTRIEPSILFQMTDFTKEKTVDLNAKVYKDVSFGTVWGGISYRRSFDGAQFQSNGSFGEQRLQLFTPIIGVNVNRFLFSYNYSYQSGDIRFDNGGFHQITLGYDFGQSDQGKRYDCYCPAANN
ncbi:MULTISPECIES: PorP/SprF family type IX secretion system membrane protein [Flavobacteriaceae]|uniref:Type IX secretion system membrane protein PorP/SprF n=1 Tax=Flagellimonas alvinocaridis TaxID=2530200 RepID=A0A4S8RUL1_9FLAO|nr:MULTISPECIES: type IX secretion system membrane protein PorP/SprF [Allomuricauda]MDC6361446.1 type IX secretion system membrane protein PorP/SprF [Muricauda sp. SP22]THV58919.1 type IX secretion system membrane protein PorP/SprF [Allomuricauda alvinocaridis]